MGKHRLKPTKKFLIKGPYARGGTYVNRLKNKSGQKIPTAGFYAEAGFGGVSAESDIFDVTVKGPNAFVEAEANDDRVTAMVKTEVASVSASAGPIQAKAGLNANAAISAEASDDRVTAMAKAEVASFSASAGPIQAKAGLEVNAGISAEVKHDRVSAMAKAEVVSFSASVGPIQAKTGLEVNAAVSAKASDDGVAVIAKAEVVSVSANAGPLEAKLGIAVDTGISAGADGVEVKFLGTGLKLGPTTEVSVFGNSISFSFSKLSRFF
ncbi:uncharacterized protein LOC128636087 [Bombina bombina]|uniref:uncharacterized protein LOC128636087 n=1 Tax=Bombina bombina TaxID=8345 RepID=UPI00235AFCB0|nr:uncharacterized protein LOC128636087 [Bombina bombina]